MQGWHPITNGGGEVRASERGSQMPCGEQGSAVAGEHGQGHRRVGRRPLGNQPHQENLSHHPQRYLGNHTTLKVNTLQQVADI